MKKIFIVGLFAVYFLFFNKIGIAAIQDTTIFRRHSETEGKAYKVRATVKKIFREEKKITLAHEKIKGVMPAMTMNFPVSIPSILDEVKIGSRRTFTMLLYKGFLTVTGVKSLPTRQRTTK